jgi:hypothetical protein
VTDCCALALKDSIAKPVIELKIKMGTDNTTKDVSNSWRIVIVVQDDNVLVRVYTTALCYMSSE